MLRLFESTAFYMLLTEKTIKGIIDFLLIYFITLLLVGVPFSILNFNREEESRLQTEDFGWWLLNTFIDEYYIHIGVDYATVIPNVVGQDDSWYTSLIFMISTFFT